MSGAMTGETSGETSGARRDGAQTDDAARRREAIARTAAVRAAYLHELGIAYGPATRHTFDLYLPEGRPVGPTIVFLHGGGFRVGEPGTVGDHGLPYLRSGAIFVAMGYRLVPGARFPESAADVERGLAAQVGLRPGPDLDPRPVKGLVLISGMYDLSEQPDEIVDRASARYVADLCEGIEHLPQHTVTVAGDADFPNARRDAVRLAETIRVLGGSVESFVEPGADHFAANRSFVTPDGAVAEAIEAMMGLREDAQARSRG